MCLLKTVTHQHGRYAASLGGRVPHDMTVWWARLSVGSGQSLQCPKECQQLIPPSGETSSSSRPLEADTRPVDALDTHANYNTLWTCRLWYIYLHSVFCKTVPTSNPCWKGAARNVLVIVFDQDAVVSWQNRQIGHTARPILVVQAADVCFWWALNGQGQTTFKKETSYVKKFFGSAIY